MNEDIFDVVNWLDEVVSKAPRSIVHAEGLLHRSAQVLIFRDFGGRREILVQKRSMQKDRFPGKYTASCSGHIDSGESYEQGAIREMREETGVECSESDLRQIGKISASKRTGNEFAKVYEYECEPNFEFSFPPDEVESLFWMSLSEFESVMNAKPELFTPMFIEVYRFYIQNREAAR